MAFNTSSHCYRWLCHNRFLYQFHNLSIQGLQMIEKKELLYVATLRAMIRQLNTIIEDVKERKDISTDTKLVVLREMTIQLVALEFADQHLTRAYGEPPKVIKQCSPSDYRGNVQ